MRKRNQSPVLCKDSADTVAVRLKRGCGEVKAINIASNHSKNLSAMTPADVSENVMPWERVQKLARFWTQVHHILQKQAK